MFAQTTTHTTLLARVAGGADPSAWDEFCDRYGDLIQGFAARRGLQSADRDDVMQDVLVALTKSMPGFTYDPAKGRFRSYLKTVVLHAIFRKSFQSVGKLQLGEFESQAVAAEADSAVDEQWESEWRQYHLRQAMRTVATEFNRADMMAFQAYAIDGRDAAEIATSLNINVDSVYQAKSRILRRLSEIISQQVDDEG